MGNENSDAQSEETEQKETLRVANLNFSGYESSPFEYYSEDHIFEEEELNNIFKETIANVPKEVNMPNLYNETNMKALSKIDKVLKANRYSPLYNKQCGVKSGKFVGIQDFIILWYEKLAQQDGWKKLAVKPAAAKNENAKSNEKANPKPKDKANEKPKESTTKEDKKAKENSQSYETYQDCLKDYQSEFEQLMGFDFIIYASILRYVYENSELDNIIRDRSCAKYLGFMDEFFSKTFLNRNKKIYETIQFIIRNEIDVLFVQEATTKLCDELEKRDPGYRFIMSKERPEDPGISVVIFKQKSFSKADVGRKSNLKLQQIYNDKKLADKVDTFLLWDKSAFISLDNFILISTHMKEFTEAVETDLKIISTKFPTKYVIAGGTLSHCNRKHAGAKTGTKYILFPEDSVTCYKMRTKMQFQMKKGDQIIKTQNNFILYDERLNLIKKKSKFTLEKGIENGVFTIDGNQFKAKAQYQNSKDRAGLKIDNMDLLPSSTHPFDQLIVVKTLRIPKKKKPDLSDLTPEQKRRAKEERERLGFETSSSEEEEFSKPAMDVMDKNEDDDDEVF